MKKIIIFFLFVFVFNRVSAQAEFDTYNKNCFYGFSFEISKNPNWGYGELVITAVEPNSPAEKAGIAVGDIIMEINGKATYLRDNQTISEWLFGKSYDPVVKFTIRNMNAYFKDYTLTRTCINTGAVSEQLLSDIYSFYSLENTSQRSFKLPVTIELNQNVDFTDYHTYDIYEGAKGLPETDTLITSLIEAELEKKGMTRNTIDPDMVVQTYYSYDENKNFEDTIADLKLSLPRYNVGTQSMVEIPALEAGQNSIDRKGKFVINFGVSLYDRKYIDSTQLTQIWDCSIKDYLIENYPLKDYFKIHIPLLMKQFPYAAGNSSGNYRVEFNRYNYTGIYFDSEDLATILDVDIDSPAYKAGIRAGYVVKKVDGREFGYNKMTLSEAYKRFITETMEYRDPATRFTNAQGYPDCMYWDKNQYGNVAKAFSKPSYLAQFAYLYNFEKYVNTKTNGKVNFEIWDGRQIRNFTVIPEIRKSIILKAL